MHAAHPLFNQNKKIWQLPEISTLLDGVNTMNTNSCGYKNKRFFVLVWFDFLTKES